MKKYVFIVPSVANMGGAQMYIRNKVLYLRQHGWIVDVLSAIGGRAILTELQEFDFNLPELAFNIQYFSKRKKLKVIDAIIKRICTDDYDEVVIESTCIPESSWAEAVAKHIGAKHISFLLQEDNTVSDRGMQDFLLFKLRRKELFGIDDSSLAAMFSSFHPIGTNESYRLRADCTNVEADVDSPYIKRVNDAICDFRIGMLSRLDKPFVMPAIKDFCQYAQNHKDKKFLFLLMGDAPKGSGLLAQLQERIKEDAPNVSVIATGYLFPIPTKLLEQCDAFFTSAGAPWVCMRSGVPTISIDGNDFSPIGVLGRTTQHSLFRGENEPVQDCSNLMDDILIEKKYKKETPKYWEGTPDMSDHIKALKDSSSEKEYYDVEFIKPETRTDYKLKWALTIIGPENYLKLGSFKEKWTRRN